MSETELICLFILGLIIFFGGILVYIIGMSEYESFFMFIGFVIGAFGLVGMVASCKYHLENDDITKSNTIATLLEKENTEEYEINVEYDNGTYTITIKE